MEWEQTNDYTWECRPSTLLNYRITRNDITNEYTVDHGYTHTDSRFFVANGIDTLNDAEIVAKIHKEHFF